MFRRKLCAIALPLLLSAALAAPSFAADKPAASTQPPPIKPSFDCAKARGRVLLMICGDAELAALDVQEDTLLRRARAKAVHPAAVTADQDVWVGARDSCSSPACVARAYRRRMRELHDWTN